MYGFDRCIINILVLSCRMDRSRRSIWISFSFFQNMGSCSPGTKDSWLRLANFCFLVFSSNRNSTSSSVLSPFPLDEVRSGISNGRGLDMMAIEVYKELEYQTNNKYGI